MAVAARSTARKRRPAPFRTRTNSLRRPIRSGHRGRSVPFQDSLQRRSDIVSRLCEIRSRRWESGVGWPRMLQPDQRGSAARRVRFATVRPDAFFTYARCWLLDLLKTMLFDLVDQIAILRECPGPFRLQCFVLRERPLGDPNVPIQRQITYIHSKAHAKQDRKSTRLNSSHDQISYAVFCLKKKKKNISHNERESKPQPTEVRSTDTETDRQWTEDQRG